MKRKITVLLALFIALMWMPAGCSTEGPGEMERVSLGTGYVDDVGLTLSAAGSYRIPLEGAEGLLLVQIHSDSQIGSDGTEPVSISLYDENENLIQTADGTGTQEFSMEANFSGKGTLVCDKPKGQLVLTLAYAPTDASLELKDGVMLTQISTPEGTTEYDLELTENRLVHISGKTALLEEEDCSFTIYQDQTPVISDLSLYTSEWDSRAVYLEKGSYRIVFHGFDPNSICQSLVDFDVDFYPIITSGNGLTQTLGNSNEIVLGFLNGQDQWLKLRKDETLQITAASCGLATYSDGVTTFHMEAYSGEGTMVYTNGENTATAQATLPEAESEYYLHLSLENALNGVIKIAVQ